MGALLLLLFAPAIALAASWDETVDGELDDDEATPTPVGDIEEGFNVFSGQTTPTADNFTFVVPNGYAVIDAFASIQNYQSLGQVGYMRLAGGAGPLQDVQFTTGDGPYAFTNGLPLIGPGTWRVKFSSVGPSGAAYDWLYTMRGVRQLTIDASGSAGGALTVQIHGAASQRVTVLAGRRPGQTEVPGCAGMFTDIVRFRSLGQVSVNPGGTLSTPVPASLAGSRVGIQAVDRVACEVSNLVVLEL